MLVSPRPTAILSQPGATGPSPVTTMDQTGRSSFIPRAGRAEYIVTSPVMINTRETSTSEIVPTQAPAMGAHEVPRQTAATRTTPTRSDLSRQDSTASVVSRGSSASLTNSMSRDNIARSMSNVSVGGGSRKKQFVVKSKASRSRPGHLPRTPSQGKGLHQLTSMANRPEPTSPSEFMKRGHGSGIIHPEPARAPMKRSISEEARHRRSSSTESANPAPSPSRPRRPSNLSRQPSKATVERPNRESSNNSGSENDSEIEGGIEMRKPVRRVSDRKPNPPPTLQLRRTSNSDIQPRPISGLTGMARTPPQMPSSIQTTPPNLSIPPRAAPAVPVLNTSPVLVTDLPASVGSVSSVRERIAHLKNGEIPPEDRIRRNSSSSISPQSLSPSNERSSSLSGSRLLSLEKTRYALDNEAQEMIRRLSNGPVAMAGMSRTSHPLSPSPPTSQSGWMRPEKITRTMQRQMTQRDLEQEASEQHYGVISPAIVRPESRQDYFHLAVPDDTEDGNVEEDPFLNTKPRLNAELRRITRELNNVKLFGDPVGDALRRLGERKGGLGSPIVKTTTPPKRTESVASVSSSWRKRFSPDKTQQTERNHNQAPTTSPPMSRSSSFQRGDVFQGEQASRLREVTRRLWDSWPENPAGTEHDEIEHNSTSQDGQSPLERSTSSFTTNESPTRTRSRSPAERRTFGSGLRETWGSALALAGLR